MRECSDQFKAIFFLSIAILISACDSTVVLRTDAPRNPPGIGAAGAGAGGGAAGGGLAPGIPGSRRAEDVDRKWLVNARISDDQSGFWVNNLNFKENFYCVQVVKVNGSGTLLTELVAGPCVEKDFASGPVTQRLSMKADNEGSQNPFYRLSVASSRGGTKTIGDMGCNVVDDVWNNCFVSRICFGGYNYTPGMTEKQDDGYLGCEVQQDQRTFKLPTSIQLLFE